jgi:hypothetical protein
MDSKPGSDDRKRERDKANYEAKRARKLAGRTCRECGSPIPLSVNGASVYCGDSCRHAWRTRSASEYYYAHKKPVRGTAESRERVSRSRKMAWQRGFDWKPRNCRVCGKSFTPASAPQRYCAVECRALAVKAKRYGVEPSELCDLIAASGGKCALCDGVAQHVDHCHDSGRIRGLLCVTCNTGLGKLGDSPERLRRALEYLEA